MFSPKDFVSLKSPQSVVEEEEEQSNDKIPVFTGSYSTPPNAASQSKVLFGKSSNVIDFAHKYRTVPIAGSNELGLFIQKEFARYANQGDLLLSKEDLLEILRKEEQTNKSLKLSCEQIIQKAEEEKLIHITGRSFLDKEQVHFIGVLLGDISIESLSWVIKSIQKDLMTPTEKLILSRIKECFGLKIEQGSRWKDILNYIMCAQKEPETQFPLMAETYLDPVTQCETYAIYQSREPFQPED